VHRPAPAGDRAATRRACSLGVQASRQLARKIEDRQRRDAARAK